MTETEWNCLHKDFLAIESETYNEDHYERFNDALSRFEELNIKEFLKGSRLNDLKQIMETASYAVTVCVYYPIAEIEGLKFLPLFLKALSRGKDEGSDCDGLVSGILELIYEHSRDAAPMLLEMLKNGDIKNRSDAAWLLGFITSEISPYPLIRATTDPNQSVRHYAITSLSGFDSHAEVLEVLEKKLRSKFMEDRRAAALSLGNIGNISALPSLRIAKKDKFKLVQECAEFAIQEICKPDQV